MAKAGASRARLEQALNAAYGDGLLSERTLAHRLDLLFGGRLIDPTSVVGDLTVGAPRPFWSPLAERVAAVRRRIDRKRNDGKALLLPLDWTGATDEILIGRHPSCQVVLPSQNVSRLHARLVYRDGVWILQDLNSKNGTIVNTRRVGRCQIHPGDVLVIAGERIRVD
jgi:hypothetical protein